MGIIKDIDAIADGAPLSDGYFEVSLIPTNLALRMCDQLATGVLLDLKIDVLGKYVKRILNFN